MLGELAMTMVATTVTVRVYSTAHTTHDSWNDIWVPAVDSEPFELPDWPEGTPAFWFFSAGPEATAAVPSGPNQIDRRWKHLCPL